MIKNFDFGGYATKNNLKCSDGRTIIKDAFKDNDGQSVPLVWQHMHNESTNVLGHALLENREDGVYAYCKFNDTPSGENAKQLVKHGDITNLSIYANKLKQNGNAVIHGTIREVSLVLAGANPGAFIDNINLMHADGTMNYDEEEAVIFTDQDIDLKEELSHAEEEKEVAKESGKTIKDVFETLNEEQKQVVYALLGQALEDQDDDELEQSDIKHDDMYGGMNMSRNVFENHDEGHGSRKVLSHSDIQSIFDDAKRGNMTLKESFMAHADGDEDAEPYGIENIDFLFPEAKSLTPTPTFIQREMEWVQKVMAGVRNTPFSRIKSLAADITEDEARAKGYIKGNQKKDEVFKLLKRVTTPTTIYKKQKLDRDDIVDIVDFDVVVWLKAEMRMMLDEEIARAILVGDGREFNDPDKINEDNIRPIAKEADLYAPKVVVDSKDPDDLIEAVVRSRKLYKGKGNPTLYTTTDVVTDLLLQKDTTGHRLYKTKDELLASMRLSDIVEVPVMEGVTREATLADGVTTETRDLIGIMVNLNDYAVGADKGGAVNLFDDFDIDFNQYKYLMETRISGALINPATAVVLEVKKVAVGG